MSASNTLVLGNDQRLFQAIATVFDAFYSEFSDSLVWSLEVKYAKDSEGWKPRLSIDRVFETRPGEPSDWDAPVGTKLEWDTSGTETEAPGYLYIFDHTPLDQAVVEVASVNGGLRVQCGGRVDLSSEEGFDLRTHILASAEPESWGISILTSDEAYARRMLSRFVNLDRFRIERIEAARFRAVSLAFEHNRHRTAT